MNDRLGGALAAVAMVVAMAGCGGGDDSAERSAGGSSTSAEQPAAETSDDQPSVEELAADIEAAGDGSGTPEDYRCLAQVMIDNDVPSDKVEAILGDDPESLTDDEAVALLDKLGPDLAKCYGAGG